MSKVISVFFALMVMFAACSHAEASVYPATGAVVEFDFDEDIVAVEDAAGLIWEFYGVEDYQLGDLVSLLMEDNGTESIFDDKVIDARYSGFSRFSR